MECPPSALLQSGVALGAGPAMFLRTWVRPTPSARAPSRPVTVSPHPPPMKSNSLRVLLVDDHQLFRDGLQMILERAPGIMVVGAAGDAAKALELAESVRPDVIVADVHMPDGDGIALAARLKAKCPAAKLVFLSSDAHFAVVKRALDAGGGGYLLKDSAPTELIGAIQAASKGGVYLSPSIAADLVVDYGQRSAGGRASSPPPLSEREAAVLRFVAEGLRNKEMAEKLGVSIKSVETYRRRLLSKLDCSSTAELIRHGIREGLIVP
jgi:DNA-binding NarL/FixJ family response regulator